MARIFVSYRREDSPGHTGRLYDHLITHFGEAFVFRDIETIEPGADFAHAITEAVESCGVLLAVIGPQWLGARDKEGRRRLDNPRDFVRLEVAAALSRNVRVIPVLVGGASFPSEEELPPDLAPLARRNAIEISAPRFRTDMAHLIRAIQSALGETPTPASGVPRPGVQWRRWGAVGFVITITVVALVGRLLWDNESVQTQGTGGAGDAGEAQGLAPNPVDEDRKQEGTGGSGEAGMTERTMTSPPPPKEPRKKKKASASPRDAGVVQPPLEDAGTDAGVVQPPPEDEGTDAGVVQPPPEDAGTMDEDGGTGGSEAPSPPEPEPDPVP